MKRLQLLNFYQSNLLLILCCTALVPNPRIKTLLHPFTTTNSLCWLPIHLNVFPSSHLVNSGFHLIRSTKYKFQGSETERERSWLRVHLPVGTATLCWNQQLVQCETTSWMPRWCSLSSAAGTSLSGNIYKWIKSSNWTGNDHFQCTCGI